MIRIDYMSGAYGNFLKYVINRYIYRLKSANFNPFNHLGSSHSTSIDYENDSQVTATHYSFFKKKYKIDENITADDTLIRIIIDRPNIYHVYYNSVSRAGDITIDLENPEIDTIQKIESLKKEITARLVLDKLNYDQSTINLFLDKLNYDQLIKDFGVRINYPRASLRNYYYAVLREDKFGLDIFNDFIKFNAETMVEFPVGAFISLEGFIKELKKLSKLITNENFEYDQSFIELYYSFIEKNLGMRSQIKCDKIINDIFTGNATQFKVNILEEAWINCNITQTFDIHSDIDCFGDVYPTNTKIIHDQIMEKIQ